MEIIVLNYTSSKVSLYEAAIMLNYAYITGDAAACAGTLAFEMSTEDVYQKFGIPARLQMLRFLSSDERNDEEAVNSIKKLLDYYKLFSRMKYKSSKEIVMLKHLEKQLTEAFWLATEPWLDFIRKSGIREFIPLSDGKTFGCYNLNCANPEIAGAPDEFTASNLLQRIGLDHINEELFFLPSHFFDEEFAVNYKIVNDNTGTLQPNKIYLQHCFTLPLMQRLKSAELKKTKEGLSAAGSHFRKALNEWSTRCYAANNATEQPFFTKNVLTAAIEFQKHIMQNETIEFCKKVNFSVPQSDIYLGEIPVKLLWDFYKYAEIINDETHTILQQVLQDDAFAKQRWPVMILKNNSYLHTLRAQEISTNISAETLTAKKSIPVA